MQIVILFLLVTCTFNAIHIAVNVPTQSLVLVVMLMSDFMAVVSRSFSMLIYARNKTLVTNLLKSRYIVARFSPVVCQLTELH